MLRVCTRATDTCARIGGDEFAVILPHAESIAANVLRQRIHQQLAKVSIPTAEGPFSICVSIGVATLPGDAESPSELIAAADLAMYQVKQASRTARISMEEPSPALGF